MRKADGAQVFRNEEVPSTDRGSGVSTQYLVTGEIGGDTILSGISSFAPGASIPLHTHNCRELVVVLEGEADVEMESGTTLSIGVRDATWISTGMKHRFMNRGTGVMRILWVYTSPNADRTIVSTGRRTMIGSRDDRA